MKKLLLLTALLLISCGSRKSEVLKSETKKNTEIKEAENQTKTTDSKEVAKVEEKNEANVKENSKVEEQKNVEKTETTTTTTIKPIDKTKTSFVKDSKGKVWELTNAELTEIVTNATLKDNSKITSEYEKELKASQIREFNYLRNIKEKESKIKTLESKIKTFEENKNKKTDRKFSILDLWWVLLLIGMIYLGWKKRNELFA